MKIEIEKLTPPARALKEKVFTTLATHQKGRGLYTSPQLSNRSLALIGTQAFIYGLEKAYAQHHPFHLSPDMIWLLICQGFAKHVNLNAEKLRHHFVTHEGKQVIEVRNDALLAFPEQWSNVVSQLANNTEKYLKSDITKVMNPEFTTTDKDSTIACNCTLLETLQPYFYYEVFTVVCGIPWIELDGTFEDWNKVKEKTLRLLGYECDWWIDALVPVLDKIIAAAKGNMDNEFWMNIFKIHTTEQYGGSPVDGWICNFFPYYADGTLTGLKRLNLFSLPDQISSVPVTWTISNHPEVSITTKKEIELIAGFMGLEQCPETLKLKPVISWFISESSSSHIVNDKVQKMSFFNPTYFPDHLIDHSVEELAISSSYYIFLPKNLKDYSHLKTIKLKGIINKEEKEKLIQELPNTEIFLNSKRIS